MRWRRLLLLAALAAAEALAATTEATVARLLRLPLENFEQMQFFGRVGVGTPPQPFDVIFDTGSSDIWLPAASCGGCAGKRRYEPSASSSLEELPEAFRLEYGSGNASGGTMRETLALGRLSLAGVRMGRATRTSAPLQRFRADGIVGLGLEALSLVTKPSLFASLRAARAGEAAEPGATDEDGDLLARFSVYVNPLPGHEPPSQLIFGGADASLALRGAEAESEARERVQWQRFPVVPFPDARSLGFWSLRLRELAVLDAPERDERKWAEAEAEHALRRSHRPRGRASAGVVSSGGVAIVDSGTSVLLLPTRVFARTVARIQRHLARHHDGLQLRASASSVSGLACTRCAPEMFPPLALAFALEPAARGGGGGEDAKTLVLQGLDYVRCDGDVCAPQIDAHALFQSGDTRAAESGGEDVVVLGAIFLRAYYALFDVQARQVAFACGDRGACLGGRNPKLQFDAASADGRARASLLFWTRLCFSAGVLLLAFAGVLLWTLAVSAKGGRDSSGGGCGGNGAGDPTRVQSLELVGGESPSQLELESAVLLQLHARSSSSNSSSSSSRSDWEPPPLPPPPPQSAGSVTVSWRKSASFQV